MMRVLLLLFIAFPFASLSQASDSKVYTDNQIEWLKKYTDAEMKSVREAVGKVEIVNTQKFESQNEWRQQMKDQTGTYVTRSEFYTGLFLIISAIGAVIAISNKVTKKEG